MKGYHKISIFKKNISNKGESLSQNFNILKIKPFHKISIFKIKTFHKISIFKIKTFHKISIFKKPSYKILIPKKIFS